MNLFRYTKYFYDIFFNNTPYIIGIIDSITLINFVNNSMKYLYWKFSFKRQHTRLIHLSFYISETETIVSQNAGFHIVLTFYSLQC